MLVAAEQGRRWSPLKKTLMARHGIEVRCDGDWKVKVGTGKERWSPLEKTSIAKHGIESKNVKKEKHCELRMFEK